MINDSLSTHVNLGGLVEDVYGCESDSDKFRKDGTYLE